MADHVGMVAARWRQVVAAVLLSVATGWVVAELVLTPTYTASSRVFVSDEQDQQNTLQTLGLIPSQTIVALVHSAAVEQRTAADLGVPVATVASDVTASGGAVVTIVAVADTAAGARDLASSVTDSLIAVGAELRTNDGGPLATVEIVDAVVLPQERTSPDLVRTLLLSGAVGLIVAVLLAVAAGTADRVVRTRAELDRVLREAGGDLDA